MDLKMSVVLPVVLRIGLMLGTLGAMQLTFWQFSENTFLIFNGLVFLVGLHTSLTYHCQVEIWETGVAEKASIAYAIFIILLIVLVVWLKFSVDSSFIFGACLYIFYRFSDRLVFNALITQGKVMNAYTISIGVITVEILVFTILNYRLTNEILARFVLPSIVSGMLAFFAYVYFKAPNKKLINKVEKNNNDYRVAFSVHSLSILLVIMIDRVAPSISTDLKFLDSHYLLLFSYCGAAYSLGAAVLETLRPRYFIAAKSVNTLSKFFEKSDGRHIFLLTLGVAILSIVFPLAISVAIGFNDPKELSGFLRDLYIGAFLLSFFSLFLLLAYVQIFYLSSRKFTPIFVSWGCALLIRAVALSVNRLDIYLCLSVMSPAVAISILIIIDKRINRSNYAFSR